MKVLAIETSTMLGGIAISDESAGLIAEVRLNVKSTHSERLMTGIDHLLKQSSMTIHDIDFFAVATGPGSFTGLRIGLSTVKGFSFASGKPVVSVPTLEAFAWNVPYCRHLVCTVLDARKKEVYAAVFQWEEDNFSRLIQEISIKVDRLTEKIRSELSERLSDKKILFMGEGALIYREEISGIMGDKALFAPSAKMVPSPANVAQLGLKKALKGDYAEPAGLTPFYIRRSEAELKSNG
jgi:tRNA threonylcarbamoyladenosine biosynthesis protein TsaB